MNLLIGLSLTLMAIVAGMFLLAHTQKENLGNIYKSISYFVIITSFLGFLCAVCCGLCRVAHCGKGGCNSSEKCEMMSGHCMGGGEGCGTMKGHGKMGMGCGMKGMKKKCKKMCGKGEMMGMEDEGEEMEDINVEIIQKQVEKTEKPEEPAKK